MPSAGARVRRSRRDGGARCRTRSRRDTRRAAPRPGRTRPASAPPPAAHRLRASGTGRTPAPRERDRAPRMRRDHRPVPAGRRGRSPAGAWRRHAGRVEIGPRQWHSHARPFDADGRRSVETPHRSCWRRQTFTPTIQPMSYFDTNKQRASAFIIALGVFLAIALWPFASGLLGAPVLYIIFAPVYRRLAERLPDGLAAAIVIVLAILLVVLPVASIVSLVATQGPGMVRGVVESPLVDKLRDLRIGPYNVGEQLSTQFRTIGSRLLTVAGSSALGILGSLTRLTLQLTITFFGLYYLLRAPRRAWRQIRTFIPFSLENAEKLKARFKEVTISTLIGTFLTAAVQGILLGIAFWIAGLANPVFWSVMTALFSVLPVVGSGLIWIPGVIVLFLEQRYGWAIFLAVWGMVIIGGIDNLIRPWVYRRYAQIHPFITVIGAFAGLKYFGILGLLIGPLAISYFFELIRMYREEHLEHEIEPEPEEPPRVRRRLTWPGRRAGDARAG